MGKVYGLFILLLHTYIYAQPSKIEVIAIEYPPFTSVTMPNNGIAFDLLKERFVDSIELKLIERFFPPARAQKYLSETKVWCLSFYPPSKVEAVNYIPLSSSDLHIGFVAKNSHGLLSWRSLSEFEGKTVAVLRAKAGDGIYGKLNNHGAVIFPVETVEQGINLLLKGRVEVAVSDNVSFESLQKVKSELQHYDFSERPFLSLPMGVYLNLHCPNYSLIKPYLQPLRKE